MIDYGLTEYGLVVPSYEDWRELYYEKAQATLGTDVNIGNSSMVGQFLSIFSYQDMPMWEALQAVYNSQTYDGAEGIYLDEILSRRGVFRKSSAAGTGYTYIQTDKTAPWTFSVSTNTQFSTPNGTYKVSSETTLRDRVAAFKLSLSELQNSGATIVFTAVDSSSGSLKNITITTSSSTALTALATFISSSVSNTETNKVFINNNTLYVGYLASDLNKPVGLTTPIKFFASVSLGVKWSLIPVVASVKGVSHVYPGDITGMTPTPTGYISVGNFTEFYPGRQVETDAEYRVRFNDTVDEANAATRPAIYKAISDLDGVQRVRIYDNPTINNTPEAPAFTFNTVILGGEISQISETLYNKKPINTLTSGTVSYTITIEDGSTEIIHYTPAEQKNYTIKVSYKTITDQGLTEEEIQKIRDNFAVLAASFNIGTSVFNVQLQSVVLNSLNFGKLSYIKVESKLSSDPDSGYSTADISTSFAEIPIISSSDIVFEQMV